MESFIGVFGFILVIVLIAWWYSSSGYGESITDIPGVPKAFVACVAYRESTNGQNAAYNGGTYGIISASGINVNGQSLSAQKRAFKQIYDTTGGSAWAADVLELVGVALPVPAGGCPPLRNTQTA